MPRVLIGWFVSTLLMLLAVTAPAEAQQVFEHRERPALLVPLYVTFAGLQAIDVHSTLNAVDSGARESNPMVRSALRNPTAMLLLKSGTATGVVLLTERLWPHNRTAAVLTMVALNSAYISIAAHNYRAAQR